MLTYPSVLAIFFHSGSKPKRGRTETGIYAWLGSRQWRDQSESSSGQIFQGAADSENKPENYLIFISEDTADTVYIYNRVAKLHQIPTHTAFGGAPPAAFGGLRRPPSAAVSGPMLPFGGGRTLPFNRRIEPKIEHCITRLRARSYARNLCFATALSCLRSFTRTASFGCTVWCLAAGAVTTQSATSSPQLECELYNTGMLLV